MKIISKFRDCYDSVLAMGREESIVYVRHTKEIKDDLYQGYAKKVFSAIPYLYNRRHYKVLLEPIVFFFCGKIYCGFRYNRPDKIKPEFVYSLGVVKKIMKKHNCDFDKHYENPSKAYFSKITLTEIFSKSLTKTDLNVHLNSPVIVAYYECRNFMLISNPRLYEFEFLKLMDPYTTFQEISMYVGGVLRNPDANMIEVSDEVKIEGHGFNKWSFRKEPRKKKKGKVDNG